MTTTVPPNHPANTALVVLQSHHNAAKLQIRSLAVAWPSLANNGETSLPQLENLVGCVDLIKEVFDNFLTMSLQDFVGISFQIFVQLRLSLGILFALMTIEIPGWNKSEARRKVDLLAFINQMISKFEDASGPAGGSDELEGDSLTRVTGHLRIMKTTWAAKLEQSERQGVHSTMTPEDSVGDVGASELPGLDDFLDMDWLMSAL